MDLKSFLPGKDEEKEKEYYWSLAIEPGWVQAGIWDIEGEKAEVISISPSVAWETEGELISAVDASLSAAVQNLPEDMIEPTKTVFGVNSSWVTEGQIKEEYLDKIRRICSDLSLKPVGFVVLPEAISHLIKSEEGTPLNASVLGVGKESLEIALFRLGALVGTSQIARSVSIVDDVAEGLARFAGSEPFPSRIILYDGKEGELEEVKQALLNVTWDSFEKIKFLHTPKIEIVTPERKVLAVSLAGASEIASVTGVHTTKIIEPLAGIEPKEEMKEDIQNIKLPQEEVNAEELGFVVNKDVSEMAPKPEETLPLRTEVAPGLPIAPQPQTASSVASPKAGGLSLLKNLKIPSFSFLKGFKPSLPTLPKPKLAFPGKKVILYGGISLVSIFILGFLGWWFLPKATVTIYVSPQKLEEREEVTIDPGASSVNFSDHIIPGKMETTSVSGEKTKSTTGTKTVGDKSKGTVRIQNGTASALALPSGTVLASSSDLKFVTSAAVSVNAALSPSTPGEATVDVEAASIGAEYNLAKDESFKVGNYPKSEVDAVSTGDFSGGASRQIAAVSEEDQKTLETDLTEELLEKAKEELSAKAGEDEIFVEESAISSVGDKSFASKVGDEDDTLKLTMTLEVKGLFVKASDVNNLAMEILKGKVPSGYVLREGQISTSYELVEENDEAILTKANFSVNLLPEIKPEEIAKAIKGKYPTLAEDYLSTIKGFSRAEIRIKPPLPGKLKTLPRIAKNIEVEIAAE